VAVLVENAGRWKGKLRYGLAPNAPTGARIDPKSGQFSWTPPMDHAAGTEGVLVAVEGPNRQSDQMKFAITVTRPSSSGLKEVAIDLGNDVKLEMVLIPAGKFVMGDRTGDSSERPAHEVNITKPFNLGKYEVTQEQWMAVMGKNPSHFKGAENPVECFTWDDCQAFLMKLTARFAAPGEKFALPTEAQWEYACRAGTTTKWSFGDDERLLGDYAWFAGNSQHRTHPVGRKKPNAWGLYDMQGNVWEWCADRFSRGFYATSPADDPVGPDVGTARVLRGASWTYDCRQCFQYAYRFGMPPSPDGSIGFRVARTFLH
jgi:formylglycine-generating enzyme required for sulfatase activity